MDNKRNRLNRHAKIFRFRPQCDITARGIISRDRNTVAANLTHFAHSLLALALNPLHDNCRDKPAVHDSDWASTFTFTRFYLLHERSPQSHLFRQQKNVCDHCVYFDWFHSIKCAHESIDWRWINGDWIAAKTKYLSEPIPQRNHLPLIVVANMFKFWCFAVLVACATATQFHEGEGTSDGGRLNGGLVARRGQFPYQVSLQKLVSREHFCGGCLIASRFILSTVSCTSGPLSKPYNVYAVVGAHLRNGTGGQWMKLDRIVNHPNYVGRFRQNDISVLRTFDAIVFTNAVRPIALPTTDVPVAGNVPATVSGWGVLMVSALPTKIVPAISFFRFLVDWRPRCCITTVGMAKYRHTESDRLSSTNGVVICRTHSTEYALHHQSN